MNATTPRKPKTKKETDPNATPKAPRVKLSDEDRAKNLEAKAQEIRRRAAIRIAKTKDPLTAMSLRLVPMLARVRKEAIARSKINTPEAASIDACATTLELIVVRLAGLTADNRAPTVPENDQTQDASA